MYKSASHAAKSQISRTARIHQQIESYRSPSTVHRPATAEKIANKHPPVRARISAMLAGAHLNHMPLGNAILRTCIQTNEYIPELT